MQGLLAHSSMSGKENNNNTVATYLFESKSHITEMSTQRKQQELIKCLACGERVITLEKMRY